MRFLTSVKGCTRLDKIRNECTRKESEVFSMSNTITKYRQDWPEHEDSMEERVLKRDLWYRHKEEEILVDHEQGGVIEAGDGHRPKPRIGEGR
jgi:hypothetical protein